MLLTLLRKYGYGIFAAGIGFVCILCSVGLTAILDTLLKQNIEQTDLLISAIIPALISFPVVYTLLRLTYQLNVTENTLRELSQRAPHRPA